MIEAGEVQVNGRPGQHIDRVSDEDQVLINGEQVTRPESYDYYLYNKPVGIDCVCNPDDPDSIVHVMAETEGNVRLFPVGRLDKDSHGLMLLCNHGELCQRLMHPDFYHEKEYLVQVTPEPDHLFYKNMAKGVSYNQVTTKPCLIYPETSDSFRIILTQGLNRQIRRMCQALGYKVIDLQRIRLQQLQLGEIPSGQTKTLEPDEIHSLLNLI